MNTQKLFSVLFVALFLSLALVSASITGFTFSSTTPSLSQYSNTTTFTITTTANTTVTIPSTVTLTGTSGNATVGISPISAVVNTSATSTVTLTTTTFPSNLGTYTGSFLITSNATDNQTITVTYTKDLSTSTNAAGLEIKSIEMNVEEGFGDDETYWYPLDEVSVDFKVDNPNTYDTENIEITSCLWDVTANECIMDEGDMEISDDSFDLDKGDDITITLTFQVDADKLSEGNTNYILYIGAAGDINAESSDTNDGRSTSDSASQAIEIRTDEQFVVASNIDVPADISCESSFDLSFDLWNVGDEDLNNDEVYVVVESTDLGINQVITLDDDLNAMKSVSIVAPLRITKNVTLKSYSLTIKAYEDDSLADKYLYQNSEDDEASWTVPVKVTTCSAVSSNGVSTITNIELSDQTPKAVTGSQVIIETTIKNTGSLSATYTIDVSGNSQWSTVADIDPKTFTLASGATQKVNVYLDVTGDAVTGEKEFTIKSTSGTTVSEQKVKINVEKGITSSAVINHFKTNWVVYTIVLVNLILIIAIILVVKSIASSKN